MWGERRASFRGVVATAASMVVVASSLTAGGSVAAFGAPAASGRVIRPRQTQQFTLVPGGSRRFSFAGRTGQAISIEATNTVPISCDSEITLLRPDGTTAGEGSNHCLSSTQPAFLDRFVLDRTGTWKIVVHSIATSSDDVALTLFSVHDQRSYIGINGPASDAVLSTPGRRARMTFHGKAGERISLLATTSTLESNCSQPAWPRWSVDVSTTDGTHVAAAAPACDQTAAGTKTAYSGVFALPSSGHFAVTVDADLWLTGQASVQLFRVVDDVRRLPVDGPGRVFTSTAPGRTASYSFHGHAGEAISVQATDISFFGVGQGGTQLAFSIVRPDLTVLDAHSFAQGSQFTYDTTLDQTGTWTFDVVPNGWSTGSATIAIMSG